MIETLGKITLGWLVWRVAVFFYIEWHENVCSGKGANWIIRRYG